MEKVLEKFFVEEGDTHQVLKTVANLKPAPVTISRTVDVDKLEGDIPLNKHDRKLLDEINKPNQGKLS